PVAIASREGAKPIRVAPFADTERLVIARGKQFGMIAPQPKQSRGDKQLLAPILPSRCEFMSKRPRRSTLCFIESVHRTLPGKRGRAIGGRSRTSLLGKRGRVIGNRSDNSLPRKRGRAGVGAAIDPETGNLVEQPLALRGIDRPPVGRIDQ